MQGHGHRWIHAEGEGPFEVPLPPPPFGPPPGGRDVVYVRHAGPPPGGEPGAPARDAEDIMLRRVPADVARRFRAAAGGRAMTHAQYLSGLVALHEAVRAMADGGDERAAAELERLGLGSVTV
jgi:hypothetical protein